MYIGGTMCCIVSNAEFTCFIFTFAALLVQIQWEASQCPWTGYFQQNVTVSIFPQGDLTLTF